MAQYEIRGTLHSWFKCYLLERNPLKVGNKIKFELENTEMRRSQVSVPGPPVFHLCKC